VVWLVTISAEKALVVTVGSMRLQYALTAKEASSFLGCMNRTTVSRLSYHPTVLSIH